MNRPSVSRVALLASTGIVLAAALAGCGSKSSTAAQFTPSMTAPTPGLVKLVQRSHSGSRVVVDVLIYGPEQGLDLSAFKFGVLIGNTTMAQFVPQTTFTQNALVADAGQTIAINVDGASDPSLVQVDVEKQGGGAGNGIAGNSAVVIELAFDVSGSGGTTLTLVGLGANPPQALSSNRTPIGAVTFDAASAGLRGVTTGGGGY